MLGSIYAFLQIIALFSMYYGFILSLISICHYNKNQSFKPTKKLAVIIPAHNEEKVLPCLLDSLLKVNYPKHLFTIYVIADNCTDQTAIIARKYEQVHVYERHDLNNARKGYALRWLLDQLLNNHNEYYDAFVFFDADNLVSKQFLMHMNNMLCAGHDIIQGQLVSLNPNDSVISAWHAFFHHGCLTMNIRKYNLGMKPMLLGTGFCISARTLKEVPWAAYSLAEDLEYSIQLALHNHSIALCKEAITYDEDPIRFMHSWFQRRRWIVGTLHIIFKYDLSLLIKGIKEKSWSLMDLMLLTTWPLGFINTIILSLGMLDYFGVFNGHLFHSIFWQGKLGMINTIVFILGMWLVPIAALISFSIRRRLGWMMILATILYPACIIIGILIAIYSFFTLNKKKWYHVPHHRMITIDQLE